MVTMLEKWMSERADIKGDDLVCMIETSVFCGNDKIMKEIEKRLNWRYDSDTRNMVYDGLDMTGFEGSEFENMELLSRFRDMMIPSGVLERTMVFPQFWKGGAKVFRFDKFTGRVIEIVEVHGWCTGTIIALIIHMNQHYIKNDNINN